MKMPDLSTADSTVQIVQWLVEAGQPIQRGQPLLEIETDKAVMEVESFLTGILKEVHAQPEEEVDVGQIIATIEVETPARNPAPSKPTGHAPPQTAPTEKPAPPATAASPRTGGMFARNRQAARQPAAPHHTTREGKDNDPAEA